MVDLARSYDFYLRAPLVSSIIASPTRLHKVALHVTTAVWLFHGTHLNKACVLIPFASFHAFLSSFEGRFHATLEPRFRVSRPLVFSSREYFLSRGGSRSHHPGWIGHPVLLAPIYRKGSSFYFQSLIGKIDVEVPLEKGGGEPIGGQLSWRHKLTPCLVTRIGRLASVGTRNKMVEARVVVQEEGGRVWEKIRRHLHRRKERPRIAGSR